MRKRQYFIFLLTFFLILNFWVLVQNAFAAAPALPSPLGQPTEIEYPEIQKGDAPLTVQTTPLVKYAEYLFYFLIWGSGILALLALIYAGFLYITAVGNPDKLRDAKDRIFSALLGLAIILGSYAILWQLNPHFLTFELEDLDPLINTLAPGVLVCKTANAPVAEAWVEQNGILLGNLDLTAKRLARIRLDQILSEINKSCYYIKTEGNVKADFNDQIKEIYFVPDIEYRNRSIVSVLHYGAAVFSDNDYEGIGLLFLSHMNPLVGLTPSVFKYATGSEFNLKISSIRPFKQKFFALATDINWRVRLYREIGYNKGLTDADVPFFDRMAIPTATEYFILSGGTSMLPRPLYVDSVDDIVIPKSMRIDGSPLVVLFKDALTSTWDGEKQEMTYTPKATTTSEGTGFYFQIFFTSIIMQIAVHSIGH